MLRRCVAAFIWQLWRAHLADLLIQAGGSDKKPDEKTILKWMNEMVCVHVFLNAVDSLVFADCKVRGEGEQF